MDKKLTLTQNPVAAYLQKQPDSFTREDIVRYITDNNVECVNFMYPAADGRLKTLNFIINDLEYLETILTLGERVDGSSLFPFIEAGNSDLYALPMFSTAFVDPFAELPTVGFLCRFFDKDGNPLECSPEYTLEKACSRFTEETGLTFEAMGELEYYVIKADDGTFPATDQRGYHESAPFAKFNDFRVKCMKYIAMTGGYIKYGHSEVGNFTLDGTVYEQNEIEFLPVDARKAANQLMLAKWVIRNLAAREGLDVTFAPKITVGKAGSGLHIHMRLTDADGRSVMLDKDRKLSNDALRMIGGLMALAPAITAFGNTNPTSYFRLVPHQEAPTNVCWGDRNRSVLVRVPLGWTAERDMCAELNPGTISIDIDASHKQTVEIRSADCSADIYLLIAGLAVAARYGFEHKESLEIARKTYVDVNIHDSKNAERIKDLDSLPYSCEASAERLYDDRDIFEAKGVFAPALIDGMIAKLKSYDQAEAEAAKNDPAKMLELVRRYFYCG